MAKKIRIKRETPVNDVSTEIDAHPVYLSGGDTGTEVIIEQTVYDHLKRRYSPSRMIIFSLTPDQKRALIHMLEGA